MKNFITGATITGVQNAPTALSPDLDGNVGSGGKQWTLTIDNTTDKDVETVIGDFTGAIADRLGLAPISDALVSGTFGKNTLAIMKTWTVGMPVAMKGIHVLASDAAFFAQGKVSAMAADIENQQPQEKVLNFATDVNGATFDKTVREKPSWKFLMSARTGVYVKIPKGQKVTLTFGLSAQGDAYLFLPV